VCCETVRSVGYPSDSLASCFQSRDYDVANTVDFVAATGDEIDSIGDKVEVDFVASVYAACVPLL